MWVHQVLINKLIKLRKAKPLTFSSTLICTGDSYQIIGSEKESTEKINSGYMLVYIKSERKFKKTWDPLFSKIIMKL